MTSLGKLDKDSSAESILSWLKDIELPGGTFTFQGHEYQWGMFLEDASRQVYKKGAQLGITEVQVLKTLHGLIKARYPQGALYLFPSALEVADFSKARFNPLISDNPKIARTVLDTDSVAIKRVGQAHLYLRGARVTGKIEGIKKSSSQLKGIPIDRVVFDEIDEMDEEMIDLARQRLGHSLVKEEVYLSTPSIPDFGIDRLYQESDQRVWMIKCERCKAETCLELEFPNCLKELKDGRVIRVCKKCGREIHPRNGRWVAQYPETSKDLVGFWISQLNSIFVDPASILEAYRNPPHGNIAEVYNSMLAMGYISAENQLTVNDVYACCGRDAMALNHDGPTVMGVDVGKLLHVVIGYPKSDRARKILYLGRVTDFSDLHDLAQRFNVKVAVLDMEPEVRKAREFQEGEDYEVLLCDYQERQRVRHRLDEREGIVTVRRTEICDATHQLITEPGLLETPRRCGEVEEYALEMTKLAKVLEEDALGNRVYRYRKLGPDHYYHATNYFNLACEELGPSRTAYPDAEADEARNIFDPFADPHETYQDHRSLDSYLAAQDSMRSPKSIHRRIQVEDDEEENTLDPFND